MVNADEVKEVKALMQEVFDRREEIAGRMEEFRDDIVDQIEEFCSDLVGDIEQLNQLMAAVSARLATMEQAVRDAEELGLLVDERSDDWAQGLHDAASYYDVSLLVPELSVSEWDDELDDVPDEIPEIPATIDEV